MASNVRQRGVSGLVGVFFGGLQHSACTHHQYFAGTQMDGGRNGGCLAHGAVAKIGAALWPFESHGWENERNGRAGQQVIVRKTPVLSQSLIAHPRRDRMLALVKSNVLTSAVIGSRDGQRA